MILINGKQYTEFDINKRCAELMGFIVQSEFEKLIGFTEEFHRVYPYTVWCAWVDDRGEQVSPWEQMVFTRCPENTWPIIDKCWDELMEKLYVHCSTPTRWENTIEKHNCTKLVAACICLIELNE
tara:strand:+ start:607 stop:981 length:375 start_codon:yes stop_codon:yes gene_type:complete